jgi:hypothetical protein
MAIYHRIATLTPKNSAPQRGVDTLGCTSCKPGIAWLYVSIVIAIDAWPSRSDAILGVHTGAKQIGGVRVSQ